MLICFPFIIPDNIIRAHKIHIMPGPGFSLLGAMYTSYYPKILKWQSYIRLFVILLTAFYHRLELNFTLVDSAALETTVYG